MELVKVLFEAVIVGFEFWFNAVITAASSAAMIAFEAIKQNPWIIAVILGAIALGGIRRKLRI